MKRMLPTTNKERTLRTRDPRSGGAYVVDGRDNAWGSRAPGPHAHGNAARQVTDGLRPEEPRNAPWAQQGRRGNQNSGNREPEWRRWESVRMGGSDNKGDGLASPVATGCQGNPCSTGIRWGVSPAAQMGCLRNRSGSPSGADQP